MKLLKTIPYCVMLLTMLPAVSVLAQETATLEKPAAQAMDHTVVLNDYFEAIGSEKALKAIKTLVTKGKVSMPAMGLEGKFESYQQAPDKVFMLMELPGVMEQKLGYDGETAWQNSDATGPEILEGGQRDQFIAGAAISVFSDLKDKYDSAKLGEQEEFDGENCNVLVLSKEGLEDAFHYFSVETKLHVGSKVTQESQMGAMEIVSKFSDYQEVKGIKYAYVSTIELPNGIELVTKIESVEVDPSIEASKLELPEEIKELKEDK